MSTTNPFMIVFGYLLLIHVPVIVMSIVGLVRAGRQVGDSPGRARLTQLGCAIMLGCGLFYVAAYMGLFRTIGSTGFLLVLVGLAQPLAICVLIAAAVTRRRPDPVNLRPAAAGFGAPQPVGTFSAPVATATVVPPVWPPRHDRATASGPSVGGDRFSGPDFGRSDVSSGN